MPEPEIKPVNTATLGGVTYDQNQAQGKKNEDGTYTLIFNTGEKLTYPEQRGDKFTKLEDDSYLCQYETEYGRKGVISSKNQNNAIVAPSIFRTSSNESHAFANDVDFTISGIMGATFESSKKTVAHVQLAKSKDCTIDLAANNSRVYGDDAIIDSDNASGNKVILDDEDTAKIHKISHNNYSSGSVEVTGPGTANQDDFDIMRTQKKR